MTTHGIIMLRFSIKKQKEFGYQRMIVKASSSAPQGFNIILKNIFMIQLRYS